jgi:hypothetical protein
MSNFEPIVTRERMEQWAHDPDATLFGCEQDEDLILGMPENVPLVCEYLDRTDVPMDKRTLIVLAMAEMLLLDRSEDWVSDGLARTLVAALVRNRDAVVASYDGVVGLEAEVMLRRLLGQPLPDGLPGWLLEKYNAVEPAVAADPRWRTADVVALARGIAADRAWDRLPLLADALMDAGCDDEAILAHCRQPGLIRDHSWVVNLLVGDQGAAEPDGAPARGGGE